MFLHVFTFSALIMQIYVQKAEHGHTSIFTGAMFFLKKASLTLISRLPLE